MKRGQSSGQENLFGIPELEAIKRTIKELDRQISDAIKKNDYERAKKLTDQQAELLQAMVENGEQPDPETG